MSDNLIDIKEYSHFINDVLDESGKIAMKYFRQVKDLTLKGDYSPVTEADKNIESYIRERINSQYPDHTIIGEEFETPHTSSEYTWYLDPIDGTRSFIAGKHDFGTLIALRKSNELLGGSIDCPALEERWVSFTNGSTLVNGNKTSCRSVNDLEDAVMATTSSHEFGMAKWKAYQSLEQSVKVTTTGSDCYNYGLLASGYIDIVAERLTAPHDYLPLINIVQGAGGVITDWDGNKLGFDAKNVYVLASASKDLHKLALNKLTVS